MSTIRAINFIVKKDSLQETKLVEKAYAHSLEPNQVLLAVDSFSLTANNITYAVLGEQMQYWQFFPTEEGFGCIPVWGYADVMVSNHPDVKVGQRFYGYYPMGSHLLVTVDKAGPFGFVDRTAHRKTLPSVYNFYANTARDPSITAETEALVALFRPLFVTSYLIDHHLTAHKFYGASKVLITSASSKTAQALAFLVAQHATENGLQLIGLTSKKNISFVDLLGWYDQVMAYDAISNLNMDEKYVVVDFSGNHSTQYQLQTKLGDNLAYNCLVGLVDWKHLHGEQPLPHKGEIFFAPTHAEKRQQDWGVTGFQQKVGVAWQEFIIAILESILIKKHIGAQQLEQLYLKLLNGEIDPQQGHMVHLS